MHPLVARFNESTALFSEHHKALIESLLSHTAKGIGGKSIEEIEMSAHASDDFWGVEDDDFMNWLRPYNVVDGILYIPVKGVLLHDFPYAFGSYATGYLYIWRAIERGLEDSNVRGIVLTINSPGGQVAGCFDLGDKMFAVRGQKPIRAFCHEYAYSAAYLVASATDEIWVSRTGGVGSIGVVTMHVSYEEALKKMGVEITYVFKGKHKTEGNPNQKLSVDAKSRIEADISKLYDMFTSSVARHRDLDENAVRETEALTYMADTAIEIGLADNIGTVEDARDRFLADLDEGNTTMAYTKSEQEAYDKGRSDGHSAGHTSGFEAGKVEGHKAGVEEGKKTAGTDAVKADRERRSGILALDEAKDRPQAARALADTDMSVETAKGALAAMPKESKADAPSNGKPVSAAAKNFADAMNNGEHPEAHTDGNNEDEGATGEAGTKGQPSRAERAIQMRDGSGSGGRNGKRFGRRESSRT